VSCKFALDLFVCIMSASMARLAAQRAARERTPVASSVPVSASMSSGRDGDGEAQGGTASRGASRETPSLLNLQCNRQHVANVGFVSWEVRVSLAGISCIHEKDGPRVEMPGVAAPCYKVWPDDMFPINVLSEA
jgi:hypothetical protein